MKHPIILLSLLQASCASAQVAPYVPAPLVSPTGFAWDNMGANATYFLHRELPTTLTMLIRRTITNSLLNLLTILAKHPRTPTEYITITATIEPA